MKMAQIRSFVFSATHRPFQRRVFVRVLFAAATFTLSSCAVDSRGTSRLQAPALPTLGESAKWQKLNTVAYKGKQDDIFFVNSRTGWYVNGAGKIYKTNDGGLNWVEKLSKPGTFFRTIGFIDEKVGFAGNIGLDYFPGVTDETPLYTTIDGGETWSVVGGINGPVPKGLCAIDILQSTFINSGIPDKRVVIHAAGRVGGPAYLMRSLDGGRSWKSIDLSKVAGMILDVKFFDENNGLIFAASDSNIEYANALILMTRDGGATWSRRYQSARGFESTWKASFPTRSIGYATIQNYDPDNNKSTRYVAKTTDGGSTWSEVRLVDDHFVRTFGVAFATPEIGWVGALDGGFQTTDGGKSWLRVPMGRAVNKIRLLQEGDTLFGYAIGADVYKLVATRN